MCSRKPFFRSEIATLNMRFCILSRLCSLLWCSWSTVRRFCKNSARCTHRYSTWATRPTLSLTDRTHPATTQATVPSSPCRANPSTQPRAPASHSTSISQNQLNTNLRSSNSRLASMDEASRLFLPTNTCDVQPCEIEYHLYQCELINEEEKTLKYIIEKWVLEH